MKETAAREIALSSENCLRDGSPWPKGAHWECHDWRGGKYPDGTPRAFVDSGPSPAGNPGPYLKVPYYEAGPRLSGGYKGDYDTRHRVYPRWGKGGLPRWKEGLVCLPVLRRGGWYWIVRTKPAARRGVQGGESGG